MPAIQKSKRLGISPRKERDRNSKLFSWGGDVAQWERLRSVRAALGSIPGTSVTKYFPALKNQTSISPFDKSVAEMKTTKMTKKEQ